MLRTFELAGRTYETDYDGTFETFQARAVGDPDNAPTIAMMSQLFAANRYLDLVVDLDAQALVTPAHDLLQAAEALATSDYLVNTHFAAIGGLIGHVVPKGQALAKARELAEMIAENGPLAVKAVLKSMRETADLPMSEALAHELTIGEPIIFNTNDAKEGPRAFKEKRKPNFTGT